MAFASPGETFSSMVLDTSSPTQHWRLTCSVQGAIQVQSQAATELILLCHVKLGLYCYKCIVLESSKASTADFEKPHFC